VLVAVGGSIAAWKACDLVSKLVQRGHEVDVAMTKEAQAFVRPLSFEALTHRRVFTDRRWWRSGGDASPAEHLRATERADLLVVAPCTANLIGKFAAGIADEIVSTTYLGATCPVLLAPAMNARMWRRAVVQRNVARLREDGVHLVGPEEGWLAEHETGPGRMSEPAGILAEAERLGKQV
jgi:phosphopantothenoylcysteine decarboxylase/phosphopantothenate--cysteine ligase